VGFKLSDVSHSRDARYLATLAAVGVFSFLSAGCGASEMELVVDDRPDVTPQVSSDGPDTSATTQTDGLHVCAAQDFSMRTEANPSEVKTGGTVRIMFTLERLAGDACLLESDFEIQIFNERNELVVGMGSMGSCLDSQCEVRSSGEVWTDALEWNLVISSYSREGKLNEILAPPGAYSARIGLYAGDRVVIELPQATFEVSG
jgi:hypothetical protein